MKPVFRQTLLLLLAAAAAFFPASVLTGEDQNDVMEPGEPEGTISYLRGTCMVKTEPDGEYEGVAVGQEVYAPGWVRTGPSSVADITMEDGSVVRLTPETQLTLHDYTLGNTRATGIGLLFGRIDVVVRKLMGTFEVDTATVTAGVRGTSFSVGVREDGETLVQVSEGSVSVELENRQELLDKGTAAAFTLRGTRETIAEDSTYDQWRRQALERIRNNPRAVLRGLLVRERVLVQRLKAQKSELDGYQEDWARFLRQVGYLHRNQRYDEELMLIQQQAAETRQAIQVMRAARRNLTALRSVLVVTGKIETALDQATRRRLPEIDQITAEYRRVSAAIKKVEMAERKLVRVLFILNRRSRKVRSLQNG